MDAEPFSAADVLVASAAGPELDAQLLTSLVDGPAAARVALATNKHCPPQVLAGLASDRNDDVRLAVAANASTPSHVLESLSSAGSPVKTRLAGVFAPTRREPQILAAVAANPSTPPSVLARLGQDRTVAVASATAGNPSTPPSVLTRLAHSSLEALVTQVAANPSTPPDVLAWLADHSWPEVRGQVARNPSTPPRMLAALAGDTAKVRVLLALNPAAPPELLARLLDGGDSADVARALAANPSTPPDCVDRLIGHPVTNVRWTAATYATLTRAQAVVLAGDRHVDVAFTMVKRAAASPDASAVLAAYAAAGHPLDGLTDDIIDAAAAHMAPAAAAATLSAHRRAAGVSPDRDVFARWGAPCYLPCLAAVFSCRVCKRCCPVCVSGVVPARRGRRSCSRRR